MKELFDRSSFQCSSLITKTYSTSFSSGIRLLAPSIRPAIYAIYGFVRYADDIVDTFDQSELFSEFQEDYQKALDRRISLNPILNCFQHVVHQYKLHDLVESFMDSMKMDLSKKEYTSQEEYDKYIYGSADVVGLMCLAVFVNGDQKKYDELKDYAMSLGSAFQKVNFLRDLKDDFESRGRSYFPNVNNFAFCNDSKAEIINDIENDFQEAFKGIVKLPVEGRLGVYVAYRYYKSLFEKLKSKDSTQILQDRIRISNPFKLVILFNSYMRYKLNIL